MKRKAYPDDDDRTIVDMNVEGMPWYVEHGSKDRDAASDKGEPLELSKTERRAYMRGVMTAAFLVTGIFILGGLVVILLMLFAMHH